MGHVMAYFSRTSPLRRLRVNWPALLLPAVAADTLGLVDRPISWTLVALAAAMVLIAPAYAVTLAPFALLAYGGYGLFVAHALLLWDTHPVIYGVLSLAPGNTPGFLLPEAIA